MPRLIVLLSAATLAVPVMAVAQGNDAVVKSAWRVPAGGALPAANALSTPRPANPSPDAGANLFSAMNCDGCHGGGAIGWVGPSLVDGRWRYGGTDEDVFTSIYYGRPKGMPAYGGVIGPDGVWMLVAYIRAQAQPAVVPTTSWLPGANAAVTPGPAAATPAPQPAAVASPSMPVGPPDQLIASYGCTGCHAVDHKVVGPAFRDVAGKYRGKDVEAALSRKVRTGGKGVWGDIPMIPNPGVPDADLALIVRWILSLK